METTMMGFYTVFSGFTPGYIRIMEKKMEAAIGFKV